MVVDTTMGEQSANTASVPPVPPPPPPPPPVPSTADPALQQNAKPLAKPVSTTPAAANTPTIQTFPATTTFNINHNFNNTKPSTTLNTINSSAAANTTVLAVKSSINSSAKSSSAQKYTSVNNDPAKTVAPDTKLNDNQENNSPRGLNNSVAQRPTPVTNIKSVVTNADRNLAQKAKQPTTTSQLLSATQPISSTRMRIATTTAPIVVENQVVVPTNVTQQKGLPVNSSQLPTLKKQPSTSPIGVKPGVSKVTPNPHSVLPTTETQSFKPVSAPSQPVPSTVTTVTTSGMVIGAPPPSQSTLNVAKPSSIIDLAKSSSNPSLSAAPQLPSAVHVATNTLTETNATTTLTTATITTPETTNNNMAGTVNVNGNINTNTNESTSDEVKLQTKTAVPDSKPTPTVMLPTPRPPEPHFTVPLDDDPVRRFLEMKARDDPKTPEPSPNDIQEWCELAWHRIPLTIQQAFDSFDMVRLPRSDITHCLFTLNLKSHTILRVDIQRRILAIKLVQRQISLLAVVEVKNDIDKNNPSLATEQHTLIRSLPPTSVWRNPSSRRETIPDDIPWTSGDIPLFDGNGDVIPGQPVLPEPGSVPPNEERARAKGSRSRSRPQARRKRETAIVSSGVNNNSNGNRSGTGIGKGGGSSGKPSNNTSTGSNRNGQTTMQTKVDETIVYIPPPVPTNSSASAGASSRATGTGNLSEDVFDPSEYCRLLHVLCDERMRRALDAISRPVAGYDPWNHDIAPLFNDAKYTPSPIRKVCSGVRPSDIAGLHPQVCRRSRNGAILAIKFSEFKDLYLTATRSYVRREKETASFSQFCHGLSYVSYAFCLFEEYSHLEPIILRNGPSTTARSAGGFTGFASGGVSSNSNENVGNDSRVDGPPVKKRRVSGAGVDSTSNGIGNGTGDAFILAGRTIHRGGSNGVNSYGRKGANDSDVMQDDIGSAVVVGLGGVHTENRRMEQLHSTLAENDKTVFETEEARVRMVTAILVAIREARAFAAEANTSEDRSICETVLRQLHSKLSEQVNIQPYR